MALNPRDYAEALARAVAGKSDEETTRLTGGFVSVLRRRGQAAMLPRVLAAMSKVQADGQVTVTVEAARRPAEAELADALRQLGLDASSVKIEFREDPTLLGGLRLRTADRVLDLTAARRLADLGAAIGATRTR